MTNSISTFFLKIDQNILYNFSRPLSTGLHIFFIKWLERLYFEVQGHQNKKHKNNNSKKRKQTFKRFQFFGWHLAYAAYEERQRQWAPVMKSDGQTGKQPSHWVARPT